MSNAQGETRTRKTRRSGDFESPASTNSTTWAGERNVAADPSRLNAPACSMLLVDAWWFLLVLAGACWCVLVLREAAAGRHHGVRPARPEAGACAGPAAPAGPG